MSTLRPALVKTQGRAARASPVNPPNAVALDARRIRTPIRLLGTIEKGHPVHRPLVGSSRKLSAMSPSLGDGFVNGRGNVMLWLLTCAAVDGLIGGLLTKGSRP